MGIQRMTNMTHQQIEQTAAAVSAASAGTGWVAVLSDANEVMIFLATAIAIISGGWALYDKYRQKREERKGRD